MIYILWELEKIRKDLAREDPAWRQNPASKDNPTTSTSTLHDPTICSSTFRHPLRQRPGKKLHVQGRQNHQQNQDLPPDSSSHPKARGLLSWIWDTGILMKVGRDPSWEVAHQADLNSLNKTWIAIRLVIEKRLVLILLGLYM